MILDNLGLPKIQGADDFNDSAMFAGMLEAFNWPQYIPLKMYVVSRGKYTRHPRESKYKFSRDQTIPLFAGLQRLGLAALVDPDYKTEGDFISPDVRGHIRRCAGLTATWYQDAALWLAMLYHIYVNPEHESNQILCMLWIHHDDKYLKYFCNNYKYERSIRDYWENWRQESEFAEHMIKVIRERIK